MAYSFVKTGQNSLNSNVISFTPTNPGDLLILFSRTSSGGGSPSITSVVDNNSVSWLSAIATNVYGSGPEPFFTIYYLPNCEAGITSATVTYNGGTPGGTDLLIAEYSGIATTTPLIATPVGQAQATPGTTTDAITSGSMSVASSVPAALIGIVLNAGDSDTVAGTGFTARLLADNNWMLEDKRITTTGSYAATATAPTHGAGDSYITFVLAFSEPFVAPPVTTPLGGQCIYVMP